MPSFVHVNVKPNNAKVAGIGFVVLIAFCGMCGFLGALTDRGSNNNRDAVPSPQSQASPSLTFQEKVNTLPANENLDNAKALLRNNPSKEQAYQATVHLQAISKDVAEFKEARKLLRLSQSITAKYLGQEKREARRQEQALALAAKREAAASRSASFVKPSRRSFGNYIRGPRGGCYYINGNGNKTYVDRSLCN